MAKGIAVIGDNESIKGFAAVGLDIFPCTNGEDAYKHFKEIAQTDNYAIIYITEEYFAAMDREINKYAQRDTPSIVPIPGSKGNNGAGVKRLSSFVEKAVGSDIIFNN